MLSRNELLHYSRHIILPEIDVSGQESIKHSRVLIIGLGGLGSPAAMYLAAAGVGSITIADEDRVERSNLQRQIAHTMGALDLSKVSSAKNTLHALNPSTNIRTIEAKINQAMLDELLTQESYDVILDCTDNFDTRFIINKSSVKARIPLVSATAVAFDGQLAVFNQTPNQACYQCLYSSVDLPEDDCSGQGILSPVVGTMGTLQATETLKIILNLNQGNNSFLIKYQSLKTEFDSFSIIKDPECPVCSHVS